MHKVSLVSGLTFSLGAPPLAELAPTGKLRVGIGVGPVGSAFWATRDPATGQPRGVTVDLGIDLAHRLGIPLEFVVYNNSGEVESGEVSKILDKTLK